MGLWREPLNGKRHLHLGLSRRLDFTSNSDFFIVQLVALGRRAVRVISVT